jgi:hypothetical protein
MGICIPLACFRRIQALISMEETAFTQWHANLERAGSQERSDMCAVVRNRLIYLSGYSRHIQLPGIHFPDYHSHVAVSLPLWPLFRLKCWHFEGVNGCRRLPFPMTLSSASKSCRNGRRASSGTACGSRFSSVYTRAQSRTRHRAAELRGEAGMCIVRGVSTFGLDVIGAA